MRWNKFELLQYYTNSFKFENCLLLLLFVFISSSYGQSRIEQMVEGREFKNSETGLTVQYGYISSWNTYGITFQNLNGVKFYFINCTKSVASDQESMILTQCRDLEDKSAGKIYIFPKKIIQVYPDGRFVFDVVESESDTHNSSSQTFDAAPINKPSLSNYNRKIIKRDPNPKKDYANVFYQPRYTLFDYWSDEPIFPDKNGLYKIYYATNENKSPKLFSGYDSDLQGMLVYKFKTFESCNNWCKGILFKSKSINNSKASSSKTPSLPIKKTNITAKQSPSLKTNKSPTQSKK